MDRRSAHRASLLTCCCWPCLSTSLLCLTRAARSRCLAACSAPAAAAAASLAGRAGLQQAWAAAGFASASGDHTGHSVAQQVRVGMECGGLGYSRCCRAQGRGRFHFSSLPPNQNQPPCYVPAPRALPLSRAGAGCAAGQCGARGGRGVAEPGASGEAALPTCPSACPPLPFPALLSSSLASWLEAAWCWRALWQKFLLHFYCCICFKSRLPACMHASPLRADWTCLFGCRGCHLWRGQRQ